jgi:hypothetical protein
MRLVLATKREIDMGERKLLFRMNQEQAQAFGWLVAAANRGDGAAACRLGDMCREGLGGLRFSPKQTYRWYAKSALAGDANGQNNLGACYEHGLGCTQSYVKAVKWYRLAAAQGLAYASSNLGYCYWRGHGVGMDQGAALEWFERALEQGDDRAKAMVEKLGGNRSIRVLQIAPSDTARVRPCSLAVGVVPPDGPSGQPQHSHSAAAGVIAIEPAVTTHGDDERSVIAATPAGGKSQKPERPAVQVIRGIRFVDETVLGKNFGIVGIGGVARPDGDANKSGDTEDSQ